jgi:hypothetical protein
MARTSRRARRNSLFHLPGAFELFTPSKELVLKNRWIFGPLYAVTLVFGIHDWIWSPTHGSFVNRHNTFSFGSPGNPLPTFDLSIVVGFSTLWFLFVALFGSAVSVMSLAAQLDAVENKPLDFQHLWAALRRYWLRLLGLYALFSVLVVIGIWLFFFGLLLFLLGAILTLALGFIVISRYILTPYVIIDQDVSIGEALSISTSLSSKKPGAIWGVIGVMFLISLISVVPYIGGLLSFAVGCLYSLALALRYQQLKRLGAQ